MQYDLNQLGDPKRFQQLVNAILTARFGEDARLTPLQGKDGGSDGEAGTNNPHMFFHHKGGKSGGPNLLIEPPRPGRYLFQSKYHRTGEQRLSDLRTTVVREFRNELVKNVLERADRRNVNYFFLVTNVSASRDALLALDETRSELLTKRDRLYADVWWAERITTALDWSPNLWTAFPELFPGRTPPLLGSAARKDASGLARTFRLGVTRQYQREAIVKFRQVELEHQLLDLFVDLDFQLRDDSDALYPVPSRFDVRNLVGNEYIVEDFGSYRVRKAGESALLLLLDDDVGIPRILLEGGPGQGKSTITQMVAQIYREKLLGKKDCEVRDKTWLQYCKLRIPIRLELRHFSEWLSDNAEGTLEQFLAVQLGRDSGGASVAAEDIHKLVQRSAVILILDGLDEVGNDALRDRVLDAVLETMERFQEGLNVNLRVVLTTRPPAVYGHWSKLDGFTRVCLMPLSPSRINDYVNRWLQTQIKSSDEQERIRQSFNGRRQEPHVNALARNPMQLSVLLQFIQLKDEAFPDRRADLYQEYFQKVIDRDVLKSPRLRAHRELIEGLHAFLGFQLHGSTEAAQGRRSLSRAKIIEIAGRWLEEEGHSKDLAEEYFALGEERFGLIAAVSGEGHETNYGFEVQPIQEYFAASFISNRLPNGMAHEVFGLLVPRDYWREVALFLAGLRRPNEKADLISRSRAADNEADKLWQQNGRGIVLQLLREGVFRQPQYLQIDAMRFVLESIDPSVLAYNSSPDTLIEALAEVCCSHADQEIIARIYEAAKSLEKSNDLQLLAYIHRLAAAVLPKEMYVKLVLAFSGTSREARGFVRVTGAAGSDGLLSELGTNRTYWENIGSFDLARRLWFAANRDGQVPDIAYPVGLPESLIVQFAISHRYDRMRKSKSIQLPSNNVPAIWRLHRNVQNISAYRSGEESDAALNFSDNLLALQELRWDNGGSESLSPPIERTVRDLVELSESVSSCLRNGTESDIQKSLKAYVVVIREHLGDPGIAAWVAYRCGLAMLQSRWLQRREAFPRRLIHQLLSELSAFHRIYDRYTYHRSFSSRFPSATPLAVRLETGSQPMPLDGVFGMLIDGTISEDQWEHCHWLADIAIPDVSIRPLVERCREQVPEMLRVIGGRPIERSMLRSKRLLVNDTRRILKVCRDTDDADVLMGAATILVKARFARVASPDLMVRILSAAPSSELVDRVFLSGSNRDSEVGDSDRIFAHKVAQVILEKPSNRPFRIVNRAVAFLADTEPPPTAALFEEHPDLLLPTHEHHVDGM